MKLWLITQQEATGYDTYDSAVVLAETEEAAKLIHPSGYFEWKEKPGAKSGWGFKEHDGPTYDGSWADEPNQVSAEYLGEAAPTVTDQIVCHSFNAG